MAATPLRNVRVPDARWDAAMARAKRRGTTLTYVINAALEAYAAADEPQPPGRPAPRRKAATAPPAPVIAARSKPKSCDHGYPDVKVVMGRRVCRKCD